MKPHNAHDKFAKEAFSDKARAVAFFKTFLPEALLEDIDIEKLSVLQESYITDELKEYFSDLVFKVPLCNSKNNLSICLLFEHKSTPDKHIQIQLGHYLCSHWMKALKNKDPIQPIIPIVYYQGIQEWEIPKIQDLFIGYPDSIINYLPTFDQIYIPLQSLAENQILQINNALMISALLSQRFTLKPRQLQTELERIYNLLPVGLKERNFITTIFVYTLNYSTFNKSQISTIMDNIAKPLQKDFVSTYDMIVQEGIEKGIQKGIQKGRKEGALSKTIDLILNGYKNGIEVKMLAIQTELTVTEVEQILKDHNVKF